MGALNTDYEQSKAQGYAIFDRQDDEARELIKQGKMNEAVALLKKNLAWSEDNLGPDHFCTVDTQEILAFNLNEIEQFKEAKTLNLKALNVRKRIEGENPPSQELLRTRLHLASDWFQLKYFDNAASNYEKAYSGRISILREDHVDTLQAGYELAHCWSAMGKYEKARDLNRKILETRIRTKASPSDILRSRLQLAENLFKLGDFKEARALYRKNIQSLKERGKKGGLQKCRDAVVLCDEKLRAEAENEERLRQQEIELEKALQRQRELNKKFREEQTLKESMEQERQRQAQYEQELRGKKAEEEEMELERQRQAQYEKTLKEEEAKKEAVELERQRQEKRAAREAVEERERQEQIKRVQELKEKRAGRKLKEQKRQKEKAAKLSLEESRERERQETTLEGQEKETGQDNFQDGAKPAFKEFQKRKQKVEQPKQDQTEEQPAEQTQLNFEIPECEVTKEVVDTSRKQNAMNETNETARIEGLKSRKPEITLIEVKDVGTTLTSESPLATPETSPLMLGGDEKFAADNRKRQHAEAPIAERNWEPIHTTVRAEISEIDLQSGQNRVGKEQAHSDTPIRSPSPAHGQIGVSQRKEHNRAKSEDGFYDGHHPKHNIVGKTSTASEGILQIHIPKSTTIPGSWPILVAPEILGAGPPPTVFQRLNPTSVQTIGGQETGEPGGISSVDEYREPHSAADLLLSPHSKLRPRSQSTGAPQRVKAFPLALFDTHEGPSNERSAETVDSWFRDLTRNTHALLKPLQRTRMKRVKIAILDTGIDRNHRAFQDEFSKARIKKTEDFLDSGGKGHDVCGHGTHCLGLLRKVAPEADIYVARVMKDFRGNPDPATIVKAINRAACSGIDSEGKKNWNVDVISMSLGFRSWVPEIQNAIEDALKMPVLFFAAASNNGSRLRTAFPADMLEVFCVNAADGDGIPCGFNPPIQASSPNFSTVGENVRSSWIKWRNEKDGRETDEKVMSGTSVATPIAAGVAALVLEFAMQEDPSDPDTDMILKEQLFFLRRHVGMEQVLTAMSEKIREYNNIVPWNILKARRTRKKVAVDIERLMDSRFRNE